LTYNNSLQGRFVSGKHTPVILLLLSLVAGVVGVFAVSAVQVQEWAGIDLCSIGPLMANVVSLTCYVLSAFLLSSLYLSERRIHWLTALYLWIVSLSLFAHGNMIWAVSALLFMVLLTVLFMCQPASRIEGSLFAAFALLGVASLLLPQFLLLIPLGVVYMLSVNIMSLKSFLAALLGFAAPFWLVYGTVYVYPAAEMILYPFNEGIGGLLALSVAEPLPVRLLLTLMELGVILPAAVLFVGSSVPGKPLLRRRLSFVMLASVWLLILSWLYEEDFELFYMWRIPLTAIMASYLFTLKVTKVTNIYFVFINILWLAVAALSIWQI